MIAQPLACPDSFDVRQGALFAGKYTLVRPLGVGGMGAVWVAQNEATGAEVALKFLLQTGDNAPESSARMRREAWATARLAHRGIVRVYDMIDLVDDGDRIALVMELLHGHTLAALLDARVKLSVAEAMEIVLPLLSALAYAHAAGIVHRDLKPENVFLAVDPDGVTTPKILDFGISKMRVGPTTPHRRLRSHHVITRDGEMLGTPSYMSPEQVRGKHVDARSDLFNVGILLYEMLTGRNPFASDGLHSMVVAILEEAPARIDDIPAPLWNVIERALAKSPDERFESAPELASALRAAVGLPASPSCRSPRASGSWPDLQSTSGAGAARRWPLVAGAAAAAIVAALTSAALALWTTEVPRPAGYMPTTIMAAKTPLATNGDDPAVKPDTRPAGATDPAVPAPKPAPPHAPSRAVLLARDPGF